MSSRPLLWEVVSPLMMRAVPALRAAMRAPGGERAKRLTYRCFTDPYTNFRCDVLETATPQGMRFRGTLSGVVQRSLFHFGVYEPNLTDFVTAVLRPGDVFVDVGANVGYYTLLASHLVGPAGSVVAVEAAPSTFATLKAHLELNGVMNVRVANVAAFDRETELPIYSVSNEENAGGASVVRMVGTQEAVVSAGPLAGILQPEELHRVRLIKIDIEGAEVNALRGLLPVIDQLPPQVELVVEAFHQNRAAVCELLLPHGFFPYELHNPVSPLDIAGVPRVPVRTTPEGSAGSAHTSEVTYLVFSRRDANRLDRAADSAGIRETIRR